MLALLVVALGAGGVWQFRRSQILRFASYERTAIVGLALHAVPLSLAPQTVAASERAAAEAALPPLPEGPRRPDADVVVITIDALRADHVGAYGYKRADHAQHRRARAHGAPASSAPTPRRRTRRSPWRRC